MYINELFTNENYEKLSTIASQCTQFLYESDGLPVLKNLPSTYNDVHRVKVRQRKVNGDVHDTFNEAFEDEHYNLRQRAVFANGIASFEIRTPEQHGQEPFFIFPINNFRFLYSKEVDNSSTDYKQVFDVLHEHFGPDKGNEVATDLLKFAYTQHNLAEGISSGAEIIFYNIPYFYAVRGALVDDYEHLLTILEDLQ